MGVDRGQAIAVDLTGVGSGHYLVGSDDLRTRFVTGPGFTVPDTSTDVSTDVSQERLDCSRRTCWPCTATTGPTPTRCCPPSTW